MMNTSNTLVSSTIVKTPAMDNFTNVQTLAMVAYAFEQTNSYNVLVTNMHLLNAQFMYVLYMNMYLLYTQFEDITG